jgi:hypothetical protein
MRRLLALVVPLALLAGTGCVVTPYHSHRSAYRAVSVVEYRYGGVHPIPHAGGWCSESAYHVHDYEPEPEYYAYTNNVYTYRGPTMVWYLDLHPIPTGGYCHLSGRHHHDYHARQYDGWSHSWDRRREVYVYNSPRGGHGASPAPGYRAPSPVNHARPTPPPSNGDRWGRNPPPGGVGHGGSTPPGGGWGTPRPPSNGGNYPPPSSPPPPGGGNGGGYGNGGGNNGGGGNGGGNSGGGWGNGGGSSGGGNSGGGSGYRPGGRGGSSSGGSSGGSWGRGDSGGGGSRGGSSSPPPGRGSQGSSSGRGSSSSGGGNVRW